MRAAAAERCPDVRARAEGGNHGSKVAPILHSGEKLPGGTCSRHQAKWHPEHNFVSRLWRFQIRSKRPFYSDLVEPLLKQLNFLKTEKKNSKKLKKNFSLCLELVKKSCLTYEPGIPPTVSIVEQWMQNLKDLLLRKQVLEIPNDSYDYTCNLRGTGARRLVIARYLEDFLYLLLGRFYVEGWVDLHIWPNDSNDSQIHLVNLA